MTNPQLAPDATLLTIREGLAEEYVRLIYVQLIAAEKSLGGAHVRLAINDGAVNPSYTIDAVMDLETGETTNWETFSGKTHKPLLKTKADLLSWSSEFMVLSQIRELIGEIRGYVKPKTDTLMPKFKSRA
jgi:hypothetical protein